MNALIQKMAMNLLDSFMAIILGHIDWNLDLSPHFFTVVQKGAKW
jgi:hypothetical protein